MELQTGPNFSLGQGWVSISYGDIPLPPPLKFRQKIWRYLNMDIRDLWRLIIRGVKSTWHRRTG